jgi:hypothetical protein
VLVGEQAEQLAVRDAGVAARDRQIASMATQISELLEANEALGDRLAKLEHLLSRNSRNSSSPPSKDDDLGKAPPPEKAERGGGPRRKKGKQPGRRGRTWRGPIPRAITRTGSPRACASAVPIWPGPAIWGWWIAISRRRPRSSPHLIRRPPARYSSTPTVPTAAVGRVPGEESRGSRGTRRFGNCSIRSRIAAVRGRRCRSVVASLGGS